MDLASIRTIEKMPAWEYLAEGNASLVIRLINEGCVLRFFKVTNEVAPTEHILKKIQDARLFLNETIQPLLSDMGKIIKVGELVKVPGHIANEIIKNLDSSRPAHRLHKRISNQDNFAYILPDCTAVPRELKETIKFTGDVFCVEIKLKQGNYFVYNNQSLCHFCLLQHVKNRQAKPESRSKYCPIKLFSGCQICMQNSLSGLLKTPKNNLKIFMNGRLTYGEGEHGLMEVLNSLFGIADSEMNREDAFVKLLLSILSKNLGNTEGLPVLIQEKSGSLIPCSSYDIKHDCLLEPLPPASLLGRIKSLQKFPEHNVNMVEEHCTVAGRLMHKNPFELDSGNDNVHFLQKTTLSLTMKDCSVMLTMIPDRQISLYEQLGNPHSGVYLLDITCVDIDYKPPERILKFIDQIKQGYAILRIDQ